MSPSQSVPGPSILPRCSSPSPSSSQAFTPSNYRAQRNEVGVFTTPPYSTSIKPYWRYKDESAAKKSAQEIWEIFGRYRGMRDFVGMDVARKFIQMGRTRSLRYALRKGGKKYEQPSDNADLDLDEDDDATYQIKRATGERLKVIPRTGEVYDQGKLNGAGIFRLYENHCWADEVYVELWDEWKAKQGVKPQARNVERHPRPVDKASAVKEDPAESMVKAESEGAEDNEEPADRVWSKPKRERNGTEGTVTTRESKRQRM